MEKVIDDEMDALTDIPIALPLNDDESNNNNNNDEMKNKRDTGGSNTKRIASSQQHAPILAVQFTTGLI